MHSAEHHISCQQTDQSTITGSTRRSTDHAQKSCQRACIAAYLVATAHRAALPRHRRVRHVHRGLPRQHHGALAEHAVRGLVRTADALHAPCAPAVELEEPASQRCLRSASQKRTGIVALLLQSGGRAV